MGRPNVLWYCADWLAAQGHDPAEVLRPKGRRQGPLHEPDAEHDNVPAPLHQTTWCTEQAPPHHHRDCVRNEYYDAVALPNHTFGTMYRDRSHKLVVYHGLEVGELYDMAEDPHEFTNLWDSPRHQALKLDLLKRSFDATVRAMDYGPARIMPS